MALLHGDTKRIVEISSRDLSSWDINQASMSDAIFENLSDIPKLTEEKPYCFRPKSEDFQTRIAASEKLGIWSRRLRLSVWCSS